MQIEDGFCTLNAKNDKIQPLVIDTDWKAQ